MSSELSVSIRGVLGVENSPQFGCARRNSPLSASTAATDAKLRRARHNKTKNHDHLPRMKDQKHSIEVAVRTAYVPAQSAPESNRYVFAYTITITNSGNIPARLLTRHWIITDANQKIQEVRGEGVVGE